MGQGERAALWSQGSKDLGLIPRFGVDVRKPITLVPKGSVVCLPLRHADAEAGGWRGCGEGGWDVGDVLDCSRKGL